MIRLVIVTLKIERKKENITNKEATKFYRRLYGYLDHSYYGKYKKFRKGFIHNLNGKRIGKSVILIPYNNVEQLLKFLLEHKVIPHVLTENVFMKSSDFEELMANQ